MQLTLHLHIFLFYMNKLNYESKKKKDFISSSLNFQTTLYRFFIYMCNSFII